MAEYNNWKKQSDQRNNNANKQIEEFSTQ